MPTPTAAPRAGPRQRAVQRVRAWIDSGRLADGDALPSERMLAGQLGLARGTVRAALDELAGEGLIAAPAGGLRRVRHGGRHALMASTVALLTEAPAIAAPEQVPVGQDTYIQLEVARRLAAGGRMALALDPRRLDGAGIDQLVASRPGGAIATYAVAASTSGQDLLRRLAGAGVPVVAHGDARALRGFDHVTSDQEQGGYDLTRWLISRGRRQIRCFWRFPAERDWVDERYAGHARAMREAGLKPLPAVRTPELDIPADTAAGFAALARALSGFLHEHLGTGGKAIDALMTATDGHAYQTAAACRLLGRRPGRDVLVTGYDHLTLTCPERAFEASAPAATIDKGNAAIAAALVAQLDTRGVGTLPAAPQRVVVPHRLVVTP